MYMTAASLDDLMRRVFAVLLKRRPLIKASRGECHEINGILLRLTQPRARLSRTEGRGRPFSALGELLWYLAGSRDLSFISYYVSAYKKESEDGKTIRGAYGPRLLSAAGHNQIRNVIELLRLKPNSRRAVIQLFDASDLAKPYKEIPCTCSLQFQLRGRRLHMMTHMRSNDALLGLPHDVFAFTMLQELVARSLDAEPGVYDHAVGNLHLYRDDEAKAASYLEEGWQATVLMPAMPPGDPWPAVEALLGAERRIREGKRVAIDDLNVADYWADLARLLQAFKLSRRRDRNSRATSGRRKSSAKAIAAIRSRMVSKVYDSYLLRKQESPTLAVPTSGTLDLFPTREGA